MIKYTIYFKINGIDCELDFRAGCRDSPELYDIGQAMVANIPGAEYGYILEDYK